MQLELTRFRKQQEIQLQGLGVDVDRLRREKQRLQEEYDSKVTGVRRDLERKLELQKRQERDE